MSQANTILALLLAACVLLQILIAPVASAPPAAKNRVKTSKSSSIKPRQTPLTPSQFALAATRFIVMLPFLPMLMFVPGATGVLMPMFLALQDRLQTIAPNINLLGLFGRPGNNAGIGYVSNQGVTVATTTEAPKTTTSKVPTYYRFKRSPLLKLPSPSKKSPLLKLPSPSKKINEGFKEVFDFLQRTDDVFNLLASSQPDCRRQAVCKLHHSMDPSFGKMLGNVFEILKLESKVEDLDVSETTRGILKDALRAANTGLFRQDCSTVYSKCDKVVSNKKP